MKENHIIKRGLNFVVRAVLGGVFIYFLNIFFINQGIDIKVGINAATICVTGILGVPGVGLLYGISIYQCM